MKSAYLTKRLPEGWDHEVVVKNSGSRYRRDVLYITIWNDELKLKQQWCSEPDDCGESYRIVYQDFDGYKGGNSEEFDLIPNEIHNAVHEMFAPFAFTEQGFKY